MEEVDKKSPIQPLIPSDQQESTPNPISMQFTNYLPEDIVTNLQKSLTTLYQSTPSPYCKHILTDHTSEVVCLQLSNDDKLLISSDQDYNIKLRELSSFKVTKSIKLENIAYTIHINKEKTTLMLGMSSGEIIIYDLVFENVEKVLKIHQDSVNCLIGIEDESIFFSGSSDNSIKMWKANENIEEFTFNGHSADVNSLDLTHNEYLLISGSSDCSIKIWDVNLKILVFNLNAHSLRVSIVKVCKNTDYCVSASTDKSIILWNISTYRLEHTFLGHTEAIYSLSVTENNNFVVSGSKDYTIKVWSIPHKSFVCTLFGCKGTINSIVIPKSQNSLISADETQEIRFWTVFDDIFESKPGHKTAICLVEEFSAVIEAEEEVLKLNYLKDESKNILKLKAHKDSITSISISRDLKYVGTGSNDYSIKIWDFPSIDLLFTLNGHGKYVESIIFTNNNSFIISGDWSGTINIWDFASKTLKNSFNGRTDSINSISLTPNEQFFINSGWSSQFSVWTCQNEFQDFGFWTNFKHSARVNSVACSGDSALVASGSVDKLVELWNIAEKIEIITFAGHEGEVFQVKFGLNDLFLISSGGEGLIKIWNIAEKRLERTLSGHCSAVERFVMGKEMDFIISVGFLDEIIEWKLVPSVSDRKVKIMKLLYGEIIYPDDYFYQIPSFSTPVPSLDWQICNECLKIQKKTMGEPYLCILTKTNLAEFKYIEQSNTLLIYFDNQCEAGIDLTTLSILFDSTSCTKPSMFSSPDSLKFFEYGVKNYLSGQDNSINSVHSNLTISPFKLSLLHFICNSGNHQDLSNILKGTCTFVSDQFKKSPFYYAIAKRSQKCVDLLLQYILQKYESLPTSSDFEKFQYNQLIFAIKSDFSLIIQNSSQLLPEFVESLVETSDVFFIDVPENDIPLYQFTNSAKFNEEFMFKSKSLVFIPVLKLSSRIPFAGDPGSSHSIHFLQSLLDCRITRIFKTELIRRYIETQWSLLFPLIIFYSVLTLLNLVFFCLCLSYTQYIWYYLVPLGITNLLLFIWEVCQMLNSPLTYFKDPWNLIDSLKIILTFTWILLNILEYPQFWVTFLVSVLCLIRGISAFRVLDGTRYYVILITRALNDIKFFIFMFCYGTFAFGLLFSISTSDDFSLWDLWHISYSLNFGDYNEKISSGSAAYTVYLGATIINVVLMLNLLVSILGDSFEQFQVEKAIIDIKDKTLFVLEIQKLMFWRRSNRDLLFMHGVCLPFEKQEESDWTGRILHTDRKIEKLGLELQEKIKEHSDLQVKEFRIKVEEINAKFSMMQVGIEGMFKRIEEKMQVKEN